MGHCILNKQGKVKHVCGEEIVIKFDNLVQNHPFIAGKIIPVLASAFPCELSSLNKIGENAIRAAERIKGRLK